MAGAVERDAAAPVNVDYGCPLPNQGLSGIEHLGLASSKSQSIGRRVFEQK